METDQYSEADILSAYQQGWDAYPKVRTNPYKDTDTLLAQAWQQGRDEHLKEPTNLSEIGF
jgi:hypothetical protein